MEEQEIKKNIDDSVRIFREVLEKTYLKDKMEFYGIGFERLTDFLHGTVTLTRKKDGSLKISGDLPSVMIKEEVKGLPRKYTDWRIFPMVFTFFHVPSINNKGETNGKE